MNRTDNHSNIDHSSTLRAHANRKTMKLTILAAFVAVCAFSCFSNLTISAASGSTAAIQQPESSTATPRRERFDFLVREDFFAGFAGDKEALARGMKTCEDALAKNPRHAEALVWHGGGLVFISGQHFQKGDTSKGMELWTHGLKEMDDAVALDPDNVSVLIPRGSTLISASRFMQPADTARPLLQKGLKDYEKVLQIQKPYFANLSGHARGELLYGLAEGWHRFGNEEKARAYFQRIANEAQGSARQQQATTFLETGKIPSTTMSCTGCHTK
jgi:hypothetical protein